jgi:hypothetical protein
MSAIRRIRTHLDTATERGCVRKHQPQHVEKLGHQAYYSRQQSCEAAAAGPAAGHSRAPGALRGCVRHGPRTHLDTATEHGIHTAVGSLD